MTTKVKSEFLDSALISDHTQVSAADADHVLIHDASDNTLKKALISTITSSGTSAADDITAGDAAVTISTSSGNITIDNGSSDDDIIFKGTDGGSDITALTLDMSDAGRALFNGSVDIGGTSITRTGDLTLDVSGDILLDADGENIKFLDGGVERGQIDLGSANFTLRASTSDKDMIFRVNDGGTEIAALTIDASEAGKATFNDGVKADYFKATGSIPSETSTNTAYLDFASGNARIVTKGADDSTQGGFQILQQASDGSPNNTPFHISSGGEIGIGTTDPDSDGYSYAEDLVIKAGASASDGAGLSINSGSREYGVISFLDSSSHAGEIFYQHTSDSLYFKTGAVNRWKLDNSGNMTVTGNVTAYGSVSDERLKENIKVIENPIEKIKDLKGVTFTYKKDGQKSTGLIAQDLEKVLPEAVYTSKTIADEREGEESEEHLAIRYGNTVGLLVEAIKELSVKIEKLEGK